MNKTYYRILYCVYDANGNMVSDANRGVSEVRYNSLNLPSRIVFNNVRRIENRYRADGVKLSSEVIIGKIPDDEVTIKSLVPGLITETMAGGDDAVVTPGGAKPLPDKVIDTKTYIGNYEFSGDTLLRLNTPYGYFHQGHYYVNAYDYQGNLVASGGNYACGVAQDNSYYPYGLNIYGLGNNKFTPYLFGGKEFEERQGLNLYDFHARTYAPDIARFMQPDPKADDYHWLSPYAYCGGDPINNIDPDGNNIAILIENGLIGHLALLIQQQDGSWSYYSVNGDKIYNITLGVSGGPYNDVEAGSWSSPQEFMDEAHETTKEEREKNPDTITNYDYSEAYEIETTPEQDKIIADTFTKIAKEEEYDLTSNNCAHAVQRSLLEGKVLPPVITQTISPTSTGYTFEIQRPYTLIPQPYSAYSTIKLHNPNGTKIKKEK